MATSNGTGAAARPCPATAGTLKGDIPAQPERTPLTDSGLIVEIGRVEAVLHGAAALFSREPDHSAATLIDIARCRLEELSDRIDSEGTEFGDDAQPLEQCAGAAPAAHAEALADIAREIRGWGSVGLFGAADRLEALAQELAVDAPKATTAPAATDPEWKRIAREAVWQAEHLVDRIIRTTIEAQEESGWPIRALAVRASDLVTAIMSMLDDNVTAEQLDRFHSKVYGVPRAADGAAS